MNEKLCAWIKPDNQSIALKWTVLPFKCISTISWRGIIFHVKINSYEIENGQHSKFKILLNNQLYDWGLGRWKYMAGTFPGKDKPDIDCSTHFLSIHNGFNSIMIIEKSKNSSDFASQNNVNPFGIIKTPEDLIFEIPEMMNEKITENKTKEETVSRNQITLYKKETAGRIKENLAYFEDGNLVVDEWKLRDIIKIEHEYFLTIKKENLTSLYETLKTGKSDNEHIFENPIRRKIKPEESFRK